MQHSYSERGKSQNNGQVTGAIFFSFPHLVLCTHFVLRAKCRIRLAWLIKCLLCRLHQVSSGVTMLQVTTLMRALMCKHSLIWFNKIHSTSMSSSKSTCIYFTISFSQLFIMHFDQILPYSLQCLFLLYSSNLRFHHSRY